MEPGRADVMRKTIPFVVKNLFARGRTRGRVVMVVGMHRSGTSVLAGSLQRAGLDLGRCSTWNRYNRRGNRENQEVVAFHEGLLARRGCSWHRPPAAGVSWTSAERREAARIIDSFRGSACWGFKDPRATFFHEGWTEAVPHLEFVGIFRHPSAVAASLDAREQMPTTDAVMTWTAYNRRLLTLHRERPFPLLCFDDDEAALHRQIDHAALALGLRPLGRNRFYAGELKHHAPADRPLPPEATALYEALRARQRHRAEVAA
jgi:hypothetical protein